MKVERFLRLGLWILTASCLWAGSAEAVDMRIASFNVAFGIDTDDDFGTTNDVDYTAVTSIVQRIQPDILCFEELYSDEDMTAWITAAAALGYPYYAMSVGGTFDNSMRLGVWSKFPILYTDHVRETVVDTNAAEIMRWPLHAAIDVPGALYPFHVFVTHNKAGTTTKSSRLQRAFEIYRTVNYITNMVAQDPINNVEYAIMGDFNDDIGLTQNTNFNLAYYETAKSSLGNTTTAFNDGSDIPWNTDSSWLLPYRYYPTERLAAAGMGVVDAAHTGTNLTWTHYYESTSGCYRLDYILFSDEIMNSAYGAPVGEVYNSAFDGVGVGLYKPGPIPPTNTSFNASDHRMVFADFHLIDAVAGVTPVGILSEVVDHTATNGTYVEICNTGSSSLDLEGYRLAAYLNGSTNPTQISLSGTLAGGAVYVVATSSNGFSTYWGGRTPDQTAGVIGLLNGNDTVALVKPNGAVSDIYGQIGVTPGAWGFTNSTVARVVGVSDPISTWNSTEWTNTPGTNAATPGWHQALEAADAYVSSGPALDPSVPRATNSFAITVGLTANMLASNLAAAGVFRVAGGSWIEQAMTNTSGTAWQTPAMNPAKSEGDVLEYFVRFAFQGPAGWSTNYSSTNSYTFPVTASGGGSVKPMFNEVQANGNGTDTNDFIEIVAEAGTDLTGYRIEHRNGAESIDGAAWTFTFPAFTVPDDGVVDANGHSLGFVVISQVSNYVANTDFVLPDGMLSAGDGLVLYDASGTNVLDAVVWEGDTFDIGVDDPATVSTNVPPGSRNYLHLVGTDSSTDTCPQAPNNVLMATGTWYNASMTPGALNAQQQSGSLILVPGDGDLDSILDDVDNCSVTYNPTQIDTDNDGMGDACDTDLDGDGKLNTVDNCPYNANATQSDLDGDGIGDACDLDADGDGIPNEDDPNPYYTGNLDIDFEDSALKGTLTDYTPIEIAGRLWVLSNALVVSTSDVSDRIEGLRGARLRGNGSMNLVGALTNGIGDFEFAYARYKTDNGLTIVPQYNAGAGWVAISTGKTANITALKTNSVTVNVVGPVNFRIAWTYSSNNRDDANLDNIFLSDYTPAAVAGCTLDAPATAAFDGLEHTADFTVTPLGVPYDVTWWPASPVGIGTYGATVTVVDTETVIGGTFVFPGALTITQGVATCTLDAPVSATYDGGAQTNSFTVTTGLAWSVSYSPTNPVDPGSYDATVTVTGDANYLGGVFVFSNAVVITQAQATCAMVGEPLTVPYNGAAHTNSFTVTPGLAWSVSYSPSDPPVAVGTYDATVSVTGDNRYLGVTSYFASAVTIQSTGQVEHTVGDAYVINCEDPYVPDYNAYGPHTNVLAATAPASWFLNNATRGNLSNDVKTASYSLRLRYIGSAATSNGVVQSVAPFPGIHSVAFHYALYGTSSKGTLSLQTSANGTDWTVYTNLVVDGIHTNFAYFSNTLAMTESVYVRFQLVDGNALNMVNLDDIVIQPYVAVPATVTLSNLAQTYSNGWPRAATATTDPAGLIVGMTYNGSAVVPTDAGSYAVAATVTSPGYTGSAEGTLVVARAIDTIAFSNTTQNYNGTARAVAATTGSGADVVLTYNGSAEAPVDVGTYAVTGIVDAANFTATNTTTLTISGAALAPVFDGIEAQTAYVGATQSFAVSAAGWPTPVLALAGTTAASGYTFTATNGVLVYAPLAGDAGTRTFTFTASNTVGVSTQVVSVSVYSGAPAAPASMGASATNATDFTAAWSSVSGAAEYRLDVSPSATFAGGSGGTVNTNLIAFDFASYVGSETQGTSTYAAAGMQTAYITRGTGLTAYANGGRFNARGWANHADAATAMASGDYFEWTLQPASGTMSITNLTLNIQRSGSAASNLALRASCDSYAADLMTTSGLTAVDSTITLSCNLSAVAGLQGVSGPITFRLIGWWGGSTGSLGFEGTGNDILVAGSMEIVTPAYVAEYSNRLVAGTSEVVTGLTANTAYYFRARAASPGGASSDSPVASVTTKVAQAITSFPAIADQWTTNTVGLSATASSGLAANFTVAGGPAAITGNTNLSFTGAGTVRIVASQAGNATYAAAPGVTNAFTVTKATASVTLNNLAQNYNGSARIVTATTVPVGLTVNMSYDGSATAPTEVGTYPVIGTISDLMYQGSTSGTLVVSAPSATVTLGNLAQTYDGEPKSVTATTTPAGLVVDLTYDGSATAPTAAGSYAVAGVINDLNYSGSSTGTLVIARANAGVYLDDLWTTYDGTTKSVTASTEPEGLSVSVTYDGSAVLPVNPGAYEVVGTVNDANYMGTATETFVISKAAATVTLSGLAQTYDGVAKSVTAETVPGGLFVNMAYAGSAVAPTNAGEYAVVAIVEDSLYEGTATGALIVAKAEAGVSLSELSHFYDGYTKEATVTTAPTGLTVVVTYNGSGTLPANTGSYAVVATVAEPNYHGAATNTLVISSGGDDLFVAWLEGRSLDPEDARYATGADDDGDGMSTWQEYLADTDPAGSGSVLRLTGTYVAASASNITGMMRLTFPASTGRYYQLMYSTNLLVPLAVSNLGWGVPGMVVTSQTSAGWFGQIRVGLEEPEAP